jgi:4-aminobutyrate aminotransferase-like enzyme
MSNKNQEILDLYRAKVMPTYSPSVVVASGKGVTVRDVDGRSFYDFTSGIGVQNVGYGNKKVVEAIQHYEPQAESSSYQKSNDIYHHLSSAKPQAVHHACQVDD